MLMWRDVYVTGNNRSYCTLYSIILLVWLLEISLLGSTIEFRITISEGTCTLEPAENQKLNIIILEPSRCQLYETLSSTSCIWRVPFYALFLTIFVLRVNDQNSMAYSSYKTDIHAVPFTVMAVKRRKI